MKAQTHDERQHDGAAWRITQSALLTNQTHPLESIGVKGHILTLIAMLQTMCTNWCSPEPRACEVKGEKVDL